MVGTHLIIPGGTRVIDAAGKFVIPGGIDASVRLQKPYPKGSTGKFILNTYMLLIGFGILDMSLVKFVFINCSTRTLPLFAPLSLKGLTQCQKSLFVLKGAPGRPFPSDFNTTYLQ